MLLRKQQQAALVLAVPSTSPTCGNTRVYWQSKHKHSMCVLQQAQSQLVEACMHDGKNNTSTPCAEAPTVPAATSVTTSVLTRSSKLVTMGCLVGAKAIGVWSLMASAASCRALCGGTTLVAAVMESTARLLLTHCTMDAFGIRARDVTDRKPAVDLSVIGHLCRWLWRQLWSAACAACLNRSVDASLRATQRLVPVTQVPQSCGQLLAHRAANYNGAISGYGLINPRNFQAILSVSCMRWKFAN